MFSPNVGYFIKCKKLIFAGSVITCIIYYIFYIMTRQTEVKNLIAINTELDKVSTDPNTRIKMLNQLANKLQKVGRYKQASETYKQIVRLQCQLFGEGHHRTICSKTREMMTYNHQLDIDNKTRAYRQAKKLEEAEKMIKANEEALKRDEKNAKKASKLGQK
jgi:tetratricopeptide (TPR) repeat protein